ncbi:MAG: GHKL domain-containing protein [Desulfobacteraceae bacterium]|nr:GHKL domain-containing protein [Desulfobacteraceae bacterium]
MNFTENNHLVDLTFKSIIDALPCYLMVQDPDFNILFANQTFQNDFGQDVAGKPCYTVLKGTQHQCVICPVRDTFNDKNAHVSEETIHLSDGTIVEMIAYSAPLFDVRGEVMASIKLLANVEKVKTMHKELVTLGQSIALLSHDIKNILEGLQGGMYVVDEGIKDKDTELSVQGWDIVKRNITEITRITQNILYSAKERKPVLQKSSPVEIAQQTGQLFAEKAQSSGIQLLLQLNPDIPSLKMDVSGISRMLTNLIWNALQACQKNVQKSKHIVFVRVDYYDNYHFMFEVEDNADGMHKDIRENLFKEFFSSKGDTGTGLGLMVVEKIVKNHKGKIEILTKPDQGSLFRVIFRLEHKRQTITNNKQE